MIAEYRSAMLTRSDVLELFSEPVPKEEVVPEDETAMLASEEIAANMKGLRNAAGLWLHRIGE